MKKILMFTLVLLSCEKDPVKYSLSVTSNPPQGGFVNPTSGIYNMGETVTISAASNEFYKFKNWTGSWAGSSASIILVMDGDKMIIANFEKIDIDEDGVNNENDLCGNTPSGLLVDNTGCAASQRDTDGDGVTDDLDQCQNTYINSAINSSGCNGFENLYAPQNGGVNPITGQFTPISGEFTKFNFSTGQITTSETDWDVAFRGTSIIVNGGESLGTIDEPARTGNAAVYIATGTMMSVTEVNLQQLSPDSSSGYAISEGGGNGWYTYQGPPVNIISPTPGKILVFRTFDGKYAKMEILSYYKGAPESPNALTDESRYYSFNYEYQPNEGITNF